MWFEPSFQCPTLDLLDYAKMEWFTAKFSQIQTVFFIHLTTSTLHNNDGSRKKYDIENLFIFCIVSGSKVEINVGISNNHVDLIARKTPTNIFNAHTDTARHWWWCGQTYNFPFTKCQNAHFSCSFSSTHQVFNIVYYCCNLFPFQVIHFHRIEMDSIIT